MYRLTFGIDCCLNGGFQLPEIHRFVQISGDAAQVIPSNQGRFPVIKNRNDSGSAA